MGVTLKKRSLQSALERGVRLADRGEGLPQEWVDRTQHVGECPSKTYVAVLASALLARAAYGDAIDPRAIKTRSGPRGFSARGAIAVLAKSARDFGYDLGVPGPEPLNNQPWFHAERVDRIRLEEVRSDTRDYLRSIKAYLKAIDSLTQEEAEAALAAFISERRKVAEAKRAAAQRQLSEVEVPLARLAQAAQSFIRDDPEEGRRGQALVAAALDCVFPRVETGAIHDPYAFDVIAFRDKSDLIPSPVVQVKQKPVGVDAAVRLGEAAASEGASTALLVAVAPDQPALDDDAIANETTDLGVIVLGVERVAGLLNALAVFSDRAPEQLAAKLPTHFEKRLRDIGASPESVEKWSELVEELGE